MGLFGSIKRTLGGGGGIGLKLEVPKSFTWNDQTVTLQATLLGHKSQARTVDRIEFQLVDRPETENTGQGATPTATQYGNIVNYLWEFDGPIELAPGSQQTIEIVMPLPFTSEESQQLMPNEEKGLLGKLMNSLSTGPPTHIHYYELTAKAYLDGVKGHAKTTRPLRYGSGWRKTTSIGGIRLN